MDITTFKTNYEVINEIKNQYDKSLSSSNHNLNSVSLFYL